MNTEHALHERKNPFMQGVRYRGQFIGPVRSGRSIESAGAKSYVCEEREVY